MNERWSVAITLKDKNTPNEYERIRQDPDITELHDVFRGRKDVHRNVSRAGVSILFTLFFLIICKAI